MSEIQGTVRLKIHDGKLEEFKEVAERCMESVRHKDSGTLQYDWFFNSDQTECVVRERYRDSAAVLEHLTNLGGTAEALLAVCDLRVDFFGQPTEGLLEALKDLDLRVFSLYQSI